MLTRGVKYMFKTGENVLCFEPDSSKAKVLYNAKVLDCSVTRDRHSHRKPAYLIHFQGWNNSWDRVVQESYLLKNTEENRKLMNKLSSISTHIKRNSVRIRKIDHTLRKHFQRRSGGGGEGEESGGESSGEGESEGQASSRASVHEDDDDDSDDTDQSETSAKEGQKSEDDIGSSDDENFADDSEPTPVTLDLPESIKGKLMQDYDLIKKQNKLLILPASHNVITVLENYVKTFAVSLLCESVERQKTHRLRSQQQPLLGPEKRPYLQNSLNLVEQENGDEMCDVVLVICSISLCKEMVDGIRLMFDFTLPLTLVYDSERRQYERLIQASPPPHMLTPNDGQADSVCDSSSDEVTFRSSHRGGLPVLKRQVSPRELHQRRVTRLSSSSLSPAPHDLPPPIISAARRPGKAPQGESRRSEPPLRKIEGEGSKKRKLDVKATPVSKAETNMTSPMLTSPYTEADIMRDSMLEDISSWTLVPRHVYSASSEYKTPPSLIYGAHHLMRLFVELPDILSRMRIQSDKKPHLIKHLEMFIEYVDSHVDELLPMTSVYNRSGE